MADGANPDEAVIRAALLRLAAARGDDASFCPSEAARALAEGWRGLMPRVRAVAACLCADGLLECRQRGEPVDILSARGPIRLKRPAAGGSGT